MESNKLKITAGALSALLIAVLAFKHFEKEPLDSRAVLDRAMEQTRAQKKDLTPEQEVLARVQFALADYKAQSGNEAKTITELVPKYFDEIPINPVTKEPIKLPLQDNLTAEAESPIQMASTAKIVTGVEGFVNPNEMVDDDFVYDPKGRRDPFRPFDFSGADEMDMSLPPLERYSLGQLKVTAVLNTTGEASAVVEDATGRGYTVKKGSRVGNAKGVVVRIENEKVYVVETRTDFTGKTTRETVEMTIQRPKGKDEEGAYNSKVTARN